MFSITFIMSWCPVHCSVSSLSARTSVKSSLEIFYLLTEFKMSLGFHFFIVQQVTEILHCFMFSISLQGAMKTLRVTDVRIQRLVRPSSNRPETEATSNDWHPVSKLQEFTKSKVTSGPSWQRRPGKALDCYRGRRCISGRYKNKSRDLEAKVSLLFDQNLPWSECR